MKRIIYFCLIIALIFSLTGCAFISAEPQIPLENIVQEEENKFSCSFDGVRHDFITCLPENTEGAPLVLMLHGYGGNAESLRSTLHFEEDANPLGYAVVYVTGAPDPNDSTSASGWNSGLGLEGNKDVEFLTALAGYLQKEYSLDKSRAFAIGFSNGAFMTHRLAMEAGSTFTAVVSVAGMMPESIWAARSEKNDIGFFQITGEKDDVVPKNSDGSAKFSKAPAIEDVMDYWASTNGLELSYTKEIGKGSQLSVYDGEKSDRQVWHLFVKNGRHSWPSEDINGIDTNTLILEFLEAHK